MPSGRCHCGDVRYAFAGAVFHASICHCEDCRRCAGAAGVAWIEVARETFAITHGQFALYRSSAEVERGFCANCGTGLTYSNETVLPGLVAIQTATLDDPEAHPPQCHVQLADALAWESTAAALPGFARYPGN